MFGDINASYSTSLTKHVLFKLLKTRNTEQLFNVIILLIERKNIIIHAYPFNVKIKKY